MFLLSGSGNGGSAAGHVVRYVLYTSTTRTLTWVFPSSPDCLVHCMESSGDVQAVSISNIIILQRPKKKWTYCAPRDFLLKTNAMTIVLCPPR
ncbi:hypothetical protein ElyMa_000197100 [Elysia marginata]|uniref:Secreted protein n=1 Tax=Elysia marginata TaxID=1093978 RepID=A0AAV4EWN4_9GAST|nr:hypothetical protein ElyMa_000197100 [Elysia marginata]